MKYFFWIAFAVFLAASIPHVAYFFASFEPSQGPQAVWWWVVSYAIAVSIDVTVYLLSWTAFQRYRRYRTAKAVWQHWLLIVMCTIFSWAVNWAYAKQFHSPVMLSSAESTAPWLTSVFPFMASAFPLLGIVYTMMAETVSEAEAEEQRSRAEQITALTELARITQLPVATLRHLLQGNSRLKPATLLAEMNRSQNEPADLATPGTETEMNDSRTITGQLLAVSDAPPAVSEVQNTNPNQVATSKDGGPDKLQMTLEALKLNPDITDEVLAEYLSLKRPASARFWRLKAIEILNSQGKEQTTGPAAAVRSEWLVSNGAANGANGKR